MEHQPLEKNRYRGMKRVILLSMILLPGLTLLLILFIGYYHFRNSIQTNTIARINRVAEDHRLMIDEFLKERKADLLFIQKAYSFEDLSQPDMLSEVFENLKAQSDSFVDLGIFNAQGIHVAYQGPYKLTWKDYSEEPWFQEVIKKGSYISDIFLGFRRVPHFIIALAKEEGGNTWVIRATIDTYLFTDLVKKVRIGRTGEAYLLNEEGVFQTERRSGGNLMAKDSEKILYPEVSDSVSTFIAADTGGDEYLYAAVWLKHKPWLLVVRQQKEDAFKTLRSATYLLVLISVVAGAAIVGLAFLLTERIVRRMENIDAEKERLSGQLIQATRLAELGEMAAGFAHEINNPLQIMKSEQTLIDSILADMKQSEELKDGDNLTELKDSMRQIALQVNRCAEITQAILKFGRQSEPKTADIDLKEFIPQVTDMVAKKAAVNGISIKTDIARNIPPVYGDPGKLQQVFVNLYNNAIDAIVARHGSHGGLITIEAKATEDRHRVEIAVSDDGTGISSENLSKVFSPFFTTKPIGKGTGLGLSVCYGIIDSMGGTMEATSEKNEGATVKIILPVSNP